MSDTARSGLTVLFSVAGRRQVPAMIAETGRLTRVLCSHERRLSVESMKEVSEAADRSLLIVEDDKAFLDQLSRAMETRGFSVTSCSTVADALSHVAQSAPAYAVVDLRLADGNGLTVVSALREVRADARSIILTGYGNIATAVTAIKSGAYDYLAKPTDAEEVVRTLLAATGTEVQIPAKPMTADRIRWEHIQRIHQLCDGNISETARRLNMHRRTLQRILAKRAPR